MSKIEEREKLKGLIGELEKLIQENDKKIEMIYEEYCKSLDIANDKILTMREACIDAFSHLHGKGNLSPLEKLTHDKLYDAINLQERGKPCGKDTLSPH